MKSNQRIFYSKLARYYDYLAPSTTKKECDFLDKVFRKFGKGEILKILDLGCGTGRHTSLLQKMGHKVTGIDLSAEMLKVARGKHPEVTFIKMDFCSPKFDKNFFDAAICMWSTIGYILDKERFKEFVKNVTRVTRKLLVISSTNHEADDFLPDEISERIVRIPDGEIKTKIVRHYDDKTGVREERYEYLIDEKGKQINFIDKNRLRLWKIDEIKKLLSPKFRILKIYGDYSTGCIFNKRKSNKKIIVAGKIKL